jgi:putative FmdB family regulatory protein
MPLYDYECEQCGPFREFRSIEHRQVPVDCPGCGVLADRVLTAPQLSLMSSNNRIAETRNEKSAHEPDVVNMIGGKAKPSHARGHKQHAPHRPWMIGH